MHMKDNTYNIKLISLKNHLKKMFFIGGYRLVERICRTVLKLQSIKRCINTLFDSKPEV